MPGNAVPAIKIIFRR